MTNVSENPRYYIASVAYTYSCNTLLNIRSQYYKLLTKNVSICTSIDCNIYSILKSQMFANILPTLYKVILQKRIFDVIMLVIIYNFNNDNHDFIFSAVRT